MNDLSPFFQDNYRRINVREYARIKNISPPTASTLLSKFAKEGLLKMETKDRYVYYFTNKDDKLFSSLQREFWRIKLVDAGLIEYLQNQFTVDAIILFGSLAKAEGNPQSDIDIAVFTEAKKKVSVDQFEKKLKRKLQLFIYPNKENIGNKRLLSNIQNGYILDGGW